MGDCVVSLSTDQTASDRPTALITGITGQDGSYLAELLLEKGYEVHGIKRRSSSFNTTRIDHLYQDPHEADPRLVLHYGDLTDSTNLIRIIQQVQPDEIYNLGAQSHVAVSFEVPEYTANSDALGTLRILEAVRMLGLTRLLLRRRLLRAHEVRRDKHTHAQVLRRRRPGGFQRLYRVPQGRLCTQPPLDGPGLHDHILRVLRQVRQTSLRVHRRSALVLRR